jgi:hypothetical protein
MRANASLHADQTRREVCEPRFDLPARPLLPQHDCAALIEADNVKRILADIDAIVATVAFDLLDMTVLL